MIKWLNKTLELMFKEENKLNNKIKDLWEVDSHDKESIKKYLKIKAHQRTEINGKLTMELIALQFAIRDMQGIIYFEEIKLAR